MAKLYGATTLAELKDRLRKELEAHRSIEVERIIEDRVLDKLEKSVEFDLPEGLLEEQARMRRLRTELSLIETGLSREEIDAELKKLDEAGTEDLRREVKRFFILEKIAEDEKLFATEDDVSLRVAVLARAYGRPGKEVLAELEESGRIETLRTEIRHTKTRDFLREKAKVGKAGEAAPASGETAGAEAAPPTIEAAPPAGETVSPEASQG
jgi:trigger factor